MSVSDTILWGVISGVLSSAFIFLLVKLLSALLVPWFRSVIYHGVDISGAWHYLNFDMAQEIVLELKQHAHSISGTASFIAADQDEESGTRIYETLRSFKVSGFVQDRFIYLTLRHSDPRRLGINSYLLEVKGDGRRLEGVFSFYSIKGDQIDYAKHSLYRERALAEVHRQDQLDTLDSPPVSRKMAPQTLQKKIDGALSNGVQSNALTNPSGNNKKPQK